jgi:hypothetical protein
VRKRRFVCGFALVVVLAVLPARPVAANVPSITSAFSSGMEGWTVTGDAATGSPYWVSSGGNLGGFIEAVDAATGADLVWNAPAKFLGDRSAYYGGALRFDRKVTSVDYIPPYDVTLTGAGTSVHFALGAQPGTTWTRQKITLLPGNAVGAVTEATLRSVLANLTQVQIGAEYVNGNETNSLDNVVLSPRPPVMPKVTSGDRARFKEGVKTTFVVRASGWPTPALSIAGSLPLGLTFTDRGDGSGALTGTPRVGSAGEYSVTVSATNTVGTATQALTITVLKPPRFTSSNGATFSRSSVNSFTVSATGYPVPALTRVNELPAGLTFVDNGNGTGTLSGTPTAAPGTYALVFEATNKAATKSQSFTLTITA